MSSAKDMAAVNAPFIKRWPFPQMKKKNELYNTRERDKMKNDHRRAAEKVEMKKKKHKM